MGKQIDKQLIRVIKAVNNMRQPQFSEAANISRSLLEKYRCRNDAKIELEKNQSKFLR